MSHAHSAYTRCFWAGSIQLTNGTVIPTRCSYISTNKIEVETPVGLQGSKMVKVELHAVHEGQKSLIKILCTPLVDILTKNDTHCIRLSFYTISDKDRHFIKDFIGTHSHS